MGITLANTTRTSSVVGVRVVHVNANDRASKCGVRAGDVITHINGVGVTSHVNAIHIVQRATDIGAAMDFTLLVERRASSSSSLLTWSCCDPLEH